MNAAKIQLFRDIIAESLRIFNIRNVSVSQRTIRILMLLSGYAPVAAKVNIITMAVNTLASGEFPRRPTLEMKLFF
ncbi:MAG: hypothetical protein IKS49_00455 [Actinomycetaceae bacterium]|nr:hypothetical protein [Actinomycetaceae bacterium]